MSWKEFNKRAPNTGYKYCPRCNRVLPLKKFAVRQSGKRAGRPYAYCRTCKSAMSREFRQSDPERTRLHKRDDYARNHAANVARCAVYRAVQRGDLVRQPCSVCGAPKAQAHHEDYSRPLDVVWLCQRHHTERHIQLQNKTKNNGTEHYFHSQRN